MIFKDEAYVLDDWLTFHKGIGASHFYLYNNNSTDNYRMVLQPWIDRGLVTLIGWPDRPGQRSAYWHCIKNRAREARWIAFLDADEYLFSPRQVDILPILRSLLEQLPAIYVYSLHFGSAGHARRPGIPVLEAYTRREPFGSTDSGKSVVNPRFVRAVANAHCFKLWRGATCGTNHVAVDSPSPLMLNAGRQVYDLLRVHHYWSRSLEELAEKVRRGEAFYGHGRDLNEHLTRERSMNAEEDSSILPIWHEIRRRSMSRVAG